MVLLITLDGNGNESFREEKEDGFFPRNGFERQEDGSFIKRLGDPRNISSILKAEELKRKQEEEERKKNLPIPIVSGNVNNKHDNSYDLGYPIITDLSERRYLSASNFKEKLTYGHSRITDRGLEIFNSSVKIKDSVPIPLIDTFSLIRKIEVNEKNKSLRIWIKDMSKKLPDILVINAFK